MEENFSEALKHVLKHEGGYTNHPSDNGGATNRGVIQRVYDGYRRRKGQVPRSVRFINDEEVVEIYRTLYWNKIDGDQLPKGIDYCVFDAAVNSGPGRAARWLQVAVNKCAGTARLKIDDAIGPATLDAADDYPPHQLIDAMLDARLGFMKIARNRKGELLWPIFGEGWANRLFGYLPKGKTVRRADGVDDIAKAMAGSGRIIGKPALPAPEIKHEAIPTWLAVLIAAGAIIFGALKWMS